MRIKVIDQSKQTMENIGSTGLTFTGPMVLAGNPVQSNEATPKQYVDASLSVHINNTSMHIDATQNTFLNNITANTNEINRLYGITSNVQTQLNGLLPISGGSMSGFLTLAANPVNPLECATKQYVDAELASYISLPTGDIISKPTTVTPAGYLRCNGAYVYQSSYPALYSVIGHSFDGVNSNGVVNINYTSYSALGSGKPWKRQYDAAQNGGNLGQFKPSGLTLPVITTSAQAIVTRSFVYLLGGHGNSGATCYNTILKATINTDGTLNAFATDTNTLPAGLAYSNLITTKNRVYLLGGYNAGAPVNVIYTAPINADGTLGTFTSAGTLPDVLSHSQAVVTKNRVYLLGGLNATAITNVIYTAPINSDGTLGAFIADANVLPIPLNSSQTVVTQNRVYLISGGTTSTAITTIYVATINSDGTLTAFTADTNVLPNKLKWSQTVVNRNKVYLLGGWNGSSVIATIYVATINADGTLTAFTDSGLTLPSAYGLSQLVVNKNKVYMIGGFTGSAAVNSVDTAVIDNTGLNDYTKFYDGSINLFDGTNLTGTYTVYSDNRSPSVYFGLPNYSQIDAKQPGLYSYIKT